MPAKAAVGHTLGGCVLVETVGRDPRARAAPDPGVDALHRSRSPAAARDGARSGNRRDDWVLLKCTNGFAGQNGAIVLRAPGEA